MPPSDNPFNSPQAPSGNQTATPTPTPATFPLTTEYSNPASQPMPVTARSAEPRNLLAALLLTLAFGTTGLHQLYLGRNKQAWIRFGLVIGISLLALFAPVLAPIGGAILLLAMPALFIWGIVDVFKIYLNRVDADGNALEATSRDARVAKTIFIATIIINVAIPVLALFMSFASISSYQQTQQRARETQQPYIHI